MKNIYLAIFLLMGSHPFAFADTEVVGGLITENTTWTLSNSPYILVGKVGVDYGVTLAIEPGVEVKSDNAYDIRIGIRGIIKASGTSEQPILFHDWGGFEFFPSRNTTSGEGSLFEWCEFSNMPSAIYAENGGTQYPILTITNCKFSNIGEAIWYQYPSIIQDSYFTGCEGQYLILCHCDIINNIIKNNSCEQCVTTHINGATVSGNIIANSYSPYSIGLSARNAFISNNIIMNHGDGIECEKSFLSYNLISNNDIGISTGFNYGGANTINYNSIFNNRDYNIKLWYPCVSCYDTDAKNNWWGTTDENEIKEFIYDIDDDWELDKVIFQPWLTEPDLNVPTTSSSSSTTSTIIGASCLIEGIYGEHSIKTELLRYFRDNALNQTPEGQELIKLYYQWSPIIVKAMENDEEFKLEIKDMVDEVLPLISQ